MMIDWNEEAARLKGEVRKHGGFLTIQKDALREWFDIGKLKVNISDELRITLEEHGLFVIPHPYESETSLRVYDIESEIGQIALAVLDPQNVPETALIDVVQLIERANAGERRRSDCVPWLTAFDVFLQFLIISSFP